MGADTSAIKKKYEWNQAPIKYVTQKCHGQNVVDKNVAKQ